MLLGELLSLHRGQGLELLWRDSLSCPTEEEYVSMVNASKCCSPSFRNHELTYNATETGGLFRVAIKLMMACSTKNVDV